MSISGFFVNGPYALITTAVSADLVRRLKKKRHSGNNLTILDLTVTITKLIFRDTPHPIISEYSEFYPISFGYLHQQKKSFKSKW